jgi:hypothetical protein
MSNSSSDSLKEHIVVRRAKCEEVYFMAGDAMAIETFPSKITRGAANTDTLQLRESNKRYWRTRHGLLSACFECEAKVVASPRLQKRSTRREFRHRNLVSAESGPGFPIASFSCCVMSGIEDESFGTRLKKVRGLEGKMQIRSRPEEEWVIVEMPQLRIVPEELWEKVQLVNGIREKKFGRARLGGLDRTETSKQHLFSGLLICANCGYRLVIFAGTGSDAKYGCPNHRFKGVCPNNLTIGHDRVEQQLIGHVTEVSLRTDNLEYAISEFHGQLQRGVAEYLEEREKAQAEIPKLKVELRKLEAQAHNLGVAIAQYGTQHSRTLLSELGLVENRIDAIKGLLNNPTLEVPDVGIEQIREFVLKQANNLSALLLGDRTAAKQAIRTYFKPLVLAPKETPNGRVFTVEGTFDLFSGLPDVMLLASPTGFEPVLSP